MNWQHRHGTPARTRLHDCTVWADTTPRPIPGGLIMAALVGVAAFLFAIGAMSS